MKNSDNPNSPEFKEGLFWVNDDGSLTDMTFLIKLRRNRVEEMKYQNYMRKTKPKNKKKRRKRK